MKSHILNGRWIGAFLLIAVALCIMPAAPAQAGNGPPVGKNVYLIISLEDDFDVTSDDGSGTILVKIGNLKAGDAIFSTRYEAASGVTVSLPKSVQWKKLNKHAFTILGSFDAPNASVHLTSPLNTEPGNVDEVPRKVQEAFHAASDGLPGEFFDEFPTTVEIAQFIYDEARRLGAEEDELGNPVKPAPGPVQGKENPTLTEWLDHDHTGDTNPDLLAEPSLTADTVLEHIFRTGGETMDTTSDDTFAEADGDLFPHQPQEGDRLFGFALAIEKKKNKAKIETNMVIDVEVDIKPGNADNVIEKSDNGVVWAAILTTTAGTDSSGNDIIVFDAASEVDWDTVKLGNALAKDYKIEDADHDGNDDITLKFNVADIGLTSATKSVTVTGKTTATVPMDIVGSDHVTVKK